MAKKKSHKKIYTVSQGMKRLFKIERANEHDPLTGRSRSGSSSPGGANPSTLISCLDSLEQGLEVLSSDDPDKLIEELKILINHHGPNTEIEAFGDF